MCLPFLLPVTEVSSRLMRTDAQLHETRKCIRKRNVIRNNRWQISCGLWTNTETVHAHGLSNQHFKTPRLHIISSRKIEIVNPTSRENDIEFAKAPCALKKARAFTPSSTHMTHSLPQRLKGYHSVSDENSSSFPFSGVPTLLLL